MTDEAWEGLVTNEASKVHVPNEVRKVPVTKEAWEFPATDEGRMKALVIETRQVPDPSHAGLLT